MWSMSLKQCIHCHLHLPDSLDYFLPSKSHHEATSQVCRECYNARQRARRYWRAGLIKPLYRRCWSFGRKSLLRLRAFDWHGADLPIRIKSDIPWHKRHPERNRARAMRYLAQKKGATGSYTGADIQLQVKVQTDEKGRLRCWWCGKIIKGKYHVDHRIPLSRGGSNDARNICITHIRCNQSKYDKMPWEYNGRLI